MKRKKISVGYVSLGCAKNAVDLQVVAGHLLDAGCALAPDPDRCDVILVNTCAFIEEAREEAVAEILRACELKAKGCCRAVVVGGCFVQRYCDRLAEWFPEVDAFFGIDALDRIPEVLAKALKAKKKSPYVDVPSGLPCRVFDPPQPALRFSGAAFAYLKIAEGCVHSCSYCAIPAIRGKYRSRGMKSILAEARALIKTGVKEINVIAQDPMLWGIDLKGKKRLVDLLWALDRIRGDFWIRVLYSYPSEITDEYLDWLGNSRHAVKYVDVPLQHTDPKVLKAMARGGAVKASLAAARRLRAAVPGVTLRTTLMVGFPGETEESFERLLSDVKRMRFDHLGTFVYSPEEGTKAAEMEGRVPLKTARKRMRAVMSAQRTIWQERAKAMKGKTFRALVVAPGVARLESQAPDVDGVVLLDRAVGQDCIPGPGEFVDVLITAVSGYDFRGCVVV